MADDRWVIEVDLNAADARAEMQRLANEAAQFNQGLANANPNLTAFERGLGRSQSATRSLNQGLSTTRYALYDVGFQLGLVGAALTAVTVATYGAGIAWERNFANVIRTSGPEIRNNSAAIAVLRENFQDLASVIPITSKELAEIGTLGGQLGIAAGQLTAFTGTVARTVAVTDLTVDSAATAYGRLNALLPDVQGNFEALGSSILAVGTNSVATESDIASTATQISAMGAFAGLTAADVVALSGALASVGVQPELARGTVTRVFTLMSRAVSEGGDALDRFARISGVSSAEFARTWGTPQFGQTFLGFMQGIRSEGGNAVAALNELGITSVRDVPALLRLANAADSAGQAGGLLAQTMQDAADGFANATELADQYAIINDTVAAKMQVLGNNVENLMAVISQGGGALGGFLDFLNDLLRNLTELSRNPVGNAIIQITIAVTGLLGVLALLGAASAIGVAGLIAVTQAATGLAASTGITRLSVSALTGQLAQLGVVGTVASRAINGAAIAVRTLGAAVLALFAFEGIKLLGNWINEGVTALQGIDTSVQGSIDRVKEFRADLQGLFENPIQRTNFNLSNFFADIFGEGVIDRGTRDIRALDTAISSLLQSGNQTAAFDILNQAIRASGVSAEEFISLLGKTQDQLLLYGQATGNTGTAFDVFAQGALDAAVALDPLAVGLGLSAEELESYQGALAGAYTEFFNFGQIVSQTSIDGIASLTGFNDALAAQITAATNWADNLRFLREQGVGLDIIAQAAQLDPQILQQAVDDFAGEGTRLIDLLGQIGTDSGASFSAELLAELEAAQIAASGAFVGSKSIPVEANTGGLTRDLDTVIATYNGKTIVINASLSYAYSSGSSGTIPQSRATGGPIYGPGTGTSDSILARVSNGEWVVRAAAVRKYGHAMMDAINRGSFPKFASGGAVGGGGVNFPSAMSLGPVERGLLRALAGGGGMQISFDPVGVARLANEGNRILGSQGTR